MAGLRDLLDALSMATVSLQGAEPGVPSRVWQDLGPWLQRLTLNATRRWLPRMTASEPCQVPMYRAGEMIGDCTNFAVAQCDVCGAPCCLDHCRVDQYGDAICYLCCMGAVEARRKRQHHEHTHEHHHHGSASEGGHAYWGPKGAPAPETPEQQQAALRAAYRMLGVSRSASDEELKAALRKQLAKWHPDRQKSEKRKLESEKRFKEIQDAYRLIEKSRAAAGKAA